MVHARKLESEAAATMDPAENLESETSSTMDTAGKMQIEADERVDPAVKLELAARAHQKLLKQAEVCGDSSIQRFYSGQVIFVTGATGFLGKQLLEKLLRSCKISKAYLLLRSKKEKSIQQRLEDLLKDSVFNLLRDQRADFKNKVVAVEGDVSDLKLGICDADWDIITKEVDSIFHVAATTRFDEGLRSATLINVRGPRECLALARTCKKLSTYVHISTAFCHATSATVGQDVEECFYKSPIPPETMISVAEHMDADRLAAITADLIKDWPNTYTFTKAVAEDLIRTASDGLPICVVRPGTVISSINEPYPGWIDTNAIYSASGIVTGIGLGVIHTVPVDMGVKLGLVPCDYVNNAAIAAGREAAVAQAKGGRHAKIYTVAPMYRNPVTWGVCREVVTENRYKIPSPLAIYYGYVVETNNMMLFAILSLLMHIIPAYIADGLCLLLGQKRRFVKLAKKVYKMCSSLSYFLRNDWNFIDNNTSRLFDGMSSQDKIMFNFNITDIMWPDFILTWCLGMRKFLLKDGLKDTEYAIRKQKVFRVVHYVLACLYAYGLWKVISCLFSVVNGFVNAIF